jgi:hypothetical protein
MRFFFEQSHWIEGTPEEVFRRTVLDPSFLSKAVHRKGPIPGVTHAEIVGGGPLDKGKVRRVTLSSGGILNEEITSLQLGDTRSMRYQQISGFPFPLSIVSKTAEGEYEAKQQGSGTLFTWRAVHTLSSPLAWPLAWIVRAFFVHPLIQAFLLRASEEVRQN